MMLVYKCKTQNNNPFAALANNHKDDESDNVTVVTNNCSTHPISWH